MHPRGGSARVGTRQEPSSFAPLYGLRPEQGVLRPFGACGMPAPVSADPPLRARILQLWRTRTVFD